MNFLRQISICYLLVVILLLIIPLYSGTTGKIVGQVVDASTGEPMPGVNIVIEDTPLGAATDIDGTYLILNVPPGNYTMRAIMISYTDMVITEVRVNVDKTTQVNFGMKESTVELGETIEVVAERPLVKKDLTSTESIVSREEIENLPVENLSDVVGLQAGVVEGHFRGGRSGEVAYLVNGVPVNDPYSGDYAIEVENNSVEELSVISGTFNAEYGQAMSGVVNVVTKEGGAKFDGTINAYAGDYVSSNDNVFWDLNNYNPILNVQGTLSGPVPGFNKLKFFASGRYFYTDGYIYGSNVFLPTDSSTFNAANPPETWVVESHGVEYPFSEELAQQLINDSESISMNDSRRATGNLKFSYQLTNLDKITLEGIYQDRRWKQYSHPFRLTPTGDYKYDQSSFTGAAYWSHVFSNRTFLDIRASYFYTEYQQRVYDDIFDPRYVSAERLQVGANAFLYGGQQMWHFNRSTTTQMVKGDLTSQVNNRHQIKAGVDFKQHRLWMEEFEITPELPGRIPPRSAFNNNAYTNYPKEFAFYLQDKMEFNDVVVNAGLRYDYFDPDGVVPVDFAKPATSEKRPAETSAQFSPRVGIAYSISETGKMHVSYGHFFQIPSFFYLYVNPEFEILAVQSTPSPPPQSLTHTVGNAELQPQKTVIYEIGFQQQLGMEFGLAATAYYKDIRNLLGTEVLETTQGFKYGRYINRDYAYVQGITFEFQKRHSSGISATVDYTFQIAEGDASDPNTAFLDAQTDPPTETEKQFVPLDWDRRHQINATLTLGDLGNYALSVIARYGSGLPYTPTFQNIQTSVENSGRRPAQFAVDIYMYKNFSLWKTRYQVFLRVFNLFDRRNEVNVFTDTGRAGYSLAPLYVGGLRPAGLNTLDQYYDRPDFFSEPRRVQVGLEIQF